MSENVTRVAFIASLVYPGTRNIPTPYVTTLMAAVVLGAMTDEKGPMKLDDIGRATFVFIEDDNFGISSLGNSNFVRLSFELMDEVVDRFEQDDSTKGESPFEIDFSQPANFFLIGSAEFCQAALHFLSIHGSKTGMCDSWCVHFMRKLTGIKENFAIWKNNYEGDERQFIGAPINDLLIHARSAAQQA